MQNAILQNPAPHCLLRCKQLQQESGLSRSTIYAKLDSKSSHYDPTFPKPIKLGARSIAFIQSEVQEWIEKRIASRCNVTKAGA